MSQFVLAKWVSTPDGFHPVLPDGCGFLLIADQGQGSVFGLFRVDQEVVRSADVWSVPESLEILLHSARGYPPALASAIWHIERQEQLNESQFVSEFERILRERLSQQRSRSHCLLMSRVNEPGYRRAGEFVWVVGYRPSEVGSEVVWVSDDYQSYNDDVRTFDVDIDWLAERFR